MLKGEQWLPEENIFYDDPVFLDDKKMKIINNDILTQQSMMNYILRQLDKKLDFGEEYTMVTSNILWKQFITVFGYNESYRLISSMLLSSLLSRKSSINVIISQWM